MICKCPKCGFKCECNSRQLCNAAKTKNMCPDCVKDEHYREENRSKTYMMGGK